MKSEFEAYPAPPPARLDMDGIIKSGKKMMWSAVRYRELEMIYSAAMKEIKTKFEILDSEFDLKYKRNPISFIQTRLKSMGSVLRKLSKYRLPPTIESIESGVRDFAGIRIICPYIDDIYSIADAFLSQDDITLLEKKDYIESPKPNGYRSLHLIVSVPVFFANSKKQVTAEVQIRTVAMDFWASLEHQMRYKRGGENSERIIGELKECAETIAKTDERMLAIRKRLDAEEDVPSEDEELLFRLSKLGDRIK